MTSSITPSARRPSPGPSRDSRRSLGWPSPRARSASRTTTGWAQLPPTQPSMLPSGWTMPLAPGRADVGRRTATTVATANGRPAASSSAARVNVDAVTSQPPPETSVHALLVEDRPHLLRGDRDIDVANAEMPKRVNDGVRDGRRRADGRRLADALRADRVVRRRRDRLLELPRRRLHGRRQQVVHERSGEVVAELVVRDLLVQGWRQPHRQTAVDLPVDDHRIDDVAAVVDRDEAADVDLSGALVDVDDADVAAERERQVRRIVVVDGLEAGFHPLRMVRVGRQRDLLDRLEPVGRALDAELAGLPLEILFGRLEQVGGQLACLVADLARRDGRGRTRDRCRARRVCSEPVGCGVGVAVLDLDVAHGEAQFFRDDLGERRLVPLALRLDADTGEDLAGRMYADLTRVEHLQPEDVEVVRRTGPDDLGEAADADAHELAAGALFRLLLAQVVVADQVERLLERAAVVARGVLPARRFLVRELLGLAEVLHP